VAHEYVHTIMVPAQIPDVIDRAIRIAMAQRTVTCVIVPNDVQEEAAEWDQARGVQIDIDGRMVGFRYPMEVNLVGDSRETLRALIPQVQRKSDRAWRQRVEKNVREWWEIVEARAMTSADPLNPQRVFWELSSRLPERCIITADSGSSANWFARDLKIRPGMRASLSGTLATMGPGVPYAIAAKFAHPDRAVIALVGDGAMQMNGINALITAKHYWREWTDPRLIVLVLHNNDLNQVTWEQRVLSGDPKFSISQDLPDFPYARYAELLGFDGIRVDAPEQLTAAWDAALSAKHPVVVEAITDPDVPPLPPHIAYGGQRALGSADEGRPRRLGCRAPVVRGKDEGVLPREMIRPRGLPRRARGDATRRSTAAPRSHGPAGRGGRRRRGAVS
jgi:pyruvate dehydrogenase (quinone)